ncbi:rpoE leader peptide RseD [Citrobacter amalonaticus]|nr:rpoE leader peptide RseD [Citrobacter amalonaticus]
MRDGTLRKPDTLTSCLLVVQLMEWRFDSAWKFGLGRLYLG